MSGLTNGGSENMNGSRKELMETGDSFPTLLNGDNTYKKNHLTNIQNMKTLSFCEKENPQVLSHMNSSMKVSPTFKTFNSNCEEESGNINKKYRNEDHMFPSQTREKKEKRDLLNNTLNHFKNNENIIYGNDPDVSTITGNGINATTTATTTAATTNGVNFYVKKTDLDVNIGREISDERNVSNEDAGKLGNELKGKHNEVKNKLTEQIKEENFLVNNTCTYIKSGVTSKVRNEQNSIHNQHLENVKSVTLGNWNFSGENERRKNYQIDANKKNDGNYNNKVNDTSKEQHIEKSEENVKQREVLIDENNEKEIEGKKNYKIPFYSWVYTNHLENDILSNIYEMLGPKVVKSEEQDKEINDIKNEILNMYKENLRKPLILEYCLENINGNRKIIEIMFYLLQNNNVINMMYDPQYNELELSDRLNMEKMNSIYKGGNDEKQGYNKKKRNKSYKENEQFHEIGSTDQITCKKNETSMCDQNNEQHVNGEQNKYNKNNVDIKSSSIFEDMSRQTREFTEEGGKNVVHNILHLEKKQKIEKDGEKEHLEKDGTNGIIKQNRKEEEKEEEEEKEKEETQEEKEKTEKKKEEKKEQKKEEECEDGKDEKDGKDRINEKENSYSIYTCVSCGTKCQFHYYMLKPNKIKNVSFGILDKCVWCSECFISGKYPNILNSSNFVKVMKPAKNNFIKWTVEETEKLIEGIQKYKNQWNKISEHVQTKTPHECIYKFLTMPLSVPYFDVDRLLSLQKNKISLCESNNSLLSLLTCICSYVSPYIGAYAAKKIVDTILEKQKECTVEMEQKIKTKRKTPNNNINDVEKDLNVGADVRSDNNVDISGNDTNTAVEEQSISTYILSEQEMKEIHNIVIDASKKRAKELADLEKDNLKNLLQQLVILNTKKMNLKLKQYDYIQKYLESQNQQMGNVKKET